MRLQLLCAGLWAHSKIFPESNAVQTLQSPSDEIINQGPLCVYACQQITYLC